jgi:hypothetical protein
VRCIFCLKSPAYNAVIVASISTRVYPYTTPYSITLEGWTATAVPHSDDPSLHLICDAYMWLVRAHKPTSYHWEPSTRTQPWNVFVCSSATGDRSHTLEFWSYEYIPIISSQEYIIKSIYQYILKKKKKNVVYIY